MNGAQQIRSACGAWYLVCVVTLAPMLLLLIPRDDGPGAGLRNVFIWIGLSVLASIPFVFIIHLLAAIWETLAATLGALGSLEAKVDSYSKWFIGRTLESAAPPSTPPPPTAGPQA